mmetsp:Transcript_15106/g.40881  ORF Transcript_15106/g.40881 Transcript_15106/m.40881 type:complete len:244 (-) Transcript_15106:329-1060(-)
MPAADLLASISDLEAAGGCLGASSQSASISFLLPRRAGPFPGLKTCSLLACCSSTILAFCISLACSWARAARLSSSFWASICAWYARSSASSFSNCAASSAFCLASRSRFCRICSSKSRASCARAASLWRFCSSLGPARSSFSADMCLWAALPLGLSWWPPQPIAPGSGTATGEGPAKYGGGIPGTTIPPGIACIGGCSIVAPPGIAPGICGTSRVLPATAPVTPPVKGGSSCRWLPQGGGGA